MMRPLALAWVTWRVVRRNAASVIFMVTLPVAVAALLGSIYTAVDGRVQRVGVLAEGSGPVTTRLVSRLSASPALRVEQYSERAEVLQDVRTRASSTPRS